MSRFAKSKRTLKRRLQVPPAAAPAGSAGRARSPTHQVGYPHAEREVHRTRVRARRTAARVGRESAGGDRGAARSRGDGPREGGGSRGTASRHVGAAIRVRWTSGRIPSEAPPQSAGATTETTCQRCRPGTFSNVSGAGVDRRRGSQEGEAVCGCARGRCWGAGVRAWGAGDGGRGLGRDGSLSS